ncbi:uroporphyrinogen-III C-methyltransferase [Neptunomonas antarctica]|uniref:Uroporphyrin-3 C-methyltransferase n=1 Tax=Neptunomonas antarctica TaxID=619304 RepID=A0A1N7MKD5_9GAMM|nr:uroporphyrinogen-III C-methyltransferase [Neptunomonas antarctica]SIS86472.1 uroporphyrin-3 C-methyltransferase [Neptunomonas antarctica]
MKNTENKTNTTTKNKPAEPTAEAIGQDAAKATTGQDSPKTSPETTVDVTKTKVETASEVPAERTDNATTVSPEETAQNEQRVEPNTTKKTPQQEKKSARNATSGKRTTPVKEEPTIAATTSIMQNQEKQSATWPGKLALVISIIALGGSGYLYWQSLQTQQNDSAIIENLKQEVAKAVADATTQMTDTKSLVASQVSSVNQNLTLLQSQSSKEQKGIEELQQRLTQSIQQVTAKQSNSRKDWLLAEVEYLLRLANQRILMENTSNGALTLLKSADKILKETDDVSIYAVRKSLATDIAALESVPTYDIEGSYLKLAALNEQVGHLRLIPLTDKNQLPSLIEEITPESMSSTWTSGLKESWAKAVDKVEQLVVIQHRDEAIEPLLSPAQNYYLQQNLHLMLEQAQLALLQKNQTAFDYSLSRAEEWLSTYFEAKDATTQALLRGITELRELKIAPVMPDISGSLNALKSYLQQVTKLKEEGAA